MQKALLLLAALSLAIALSACQVPLTGGAGDNSASDASEAGDPNPSTSSGPCSLGENASLNGYRPFPASSEWNRDISGDAVDPGSATYIAAIGTTTGLKPDFGTVWEGSPIGVPYVVVSGTQARVPIDFDYLQESDPGPYPMPHDAPIQGTAASTGDRHVIAVDCEGGKLYELYRGFAQNDGSWQAVNGAVFDMTSGADRPAGWTSANAAGLPIFAGLARYDEVVEQGEVRHALSFTVAATQKGYVYPARHWASTSTRTDLPPMGMRVRLKAGFDVSGFSPTVQVILRALKKYGMFVVDNGANWFMSGSPHSRWNDRDLATLLRVKGSDFEVVRMGAIQR